MGSDRGMSGSPAEDRVWTMASTIDQLQEELARLQREVLWLTLALLALAGVIMLARYGASDA